MTGATLLSSPDRPLVVGGGIAGLTAALHLAERGLAPLLLEADPHRCGGRLAGAPATEFGHAGKTWRFPGEHGIHGFWAQYHNLRNMLERHGIAPPFVPALGQEWVYADGASLRRAEIGLWLRHSWIPAPFHYVTLFANPHFLAMFSPLDLLRLPIVGGSLLATLAVDPMTEGEVLEGFAASDLLWGWPKVVRAFAVALGRSGLSADLEEVPLAGFAAFLRFYTLLRRDSWAFDYLGTDAETAIVGPLVAAIRSAGGQVITGVAVTALERQDNDVWRVHWHRRGERKEDAWNQPDGTVVAKHVVLAVDSPAAQSILGQGATTAALASLLRWPKAQGTVTVRLWFARTPQLEAESGVFGGTFIADNFFWLHRFQDAFSQWHQATGGSAVEAHIYSPPRLFQQPDAELLALVVTDFVRTYPELRDQLLHATIQRNPATHTLFSVGTTDQHLGVETPWRGLFCCGDWVRHETPALFLERACITGLTAANAVLVTRGLPTHPVLPHAEPELLAGWMEKGYRAAFRGIRWLRAARRRMGG